MSKNAKVCKTEQLTVLNNFGFPSILVLDDCSNCKCCNVFIVEPLTYKFGEDEDYAYGEVAHDYIGGEDSLEGVTEASISMSSEISLRKDFPETWLWMELPLDNSLNLRYVIN